MNTNPELALKSAGEARRTLESLAMLFWLYGTMLERGMEDHYKERRRNADVLLSARQKVIDAANNLIREEAWVKTRFEVCGTGRHTVEDVCVYSKDYIRRLQTLIELLNELEPTLTQVKEMRKPRIDDDENLFLYLMAANWNIESQGRLPPAAIHREIATVINAWGDSLVGGVDELDEKEIGRRIDRFRERNEKVACLIDSNPAKYVIHFLFEASSDGLRRDEGSLASLTLQTTPTAPTPEAIPATTPGTTPAGESTGSTNHPPKPPER